MTGTFDSVATIITDLVNASISVIRVVTTGDNAGVVIGGFIVIVIVMVVMGLPQKLLGHYYKK